MNEENKIQKVQEKLSKTLQKLALSTAHEDLYMEYLFLVQDVMEQYAKLEQAQNTAELSNITMEIISTVEEGLENGILQETE